MPMRLQIALFISLFLAAHSAGLALAHSLQWAPKRKLGASAFLQVQQTFYTAYGPVAGLLEMGALAACIAATSMLGTSSSAFPWLLAALGCMTLMFLVWAVLIQPINRQVGKWKAEALPANWAELGVDKWHALHLVRLVLAAGALGCLIASYSSLASRSA